MDTPEKIWPCGINQNSIKNDPQVFWINGANIII